MKNSTNVIGFLSLMFVTDLTIGQEIEEFDVPIVLNTATRMPQTKADTPASMTAITSQQIRELGLRTLPDVMRLIPGMRVSQESGWNYLVSFHGTGSIVPRRMSLLMDGVPMFKGSFQQINWSKLPFDLRDIERIEVIRSPAGASYGTNAFLTVINIITKHPEDVPSVEVSAEGGSHNSRDVYARVSKRFEKTSILINASQESNDGFDNIKLPGRDWQTDINGHRVDRVNLRSNTALTPETSIQFSAGAADAVTEIYDIEPNQTGRNFTGEETWYSQLSFSTSSFENHTITANLNLDNTEFTQEWPTCYPTAFFIPALRTLYDYNPAAANSLFAGVVPQPSSQDEAALIFAAVSQAQTLGPAIYAPLCGDANTNYNEKRQAIEIGDTYVFNDKLKINSGIGYQDTFSEAESQLQGSINNYYKNLYANIEYAPNTIVTINVGKMIEKQSITDDSATSNRAGINFHLNDETTLRYAYSTSNRMPSVLEAKSRLSYFMRNWDREVFGQREGWMYRTEYSPTNLKSEHVESNEIALQGTIINGDLAYDVRVFREKLTRLISEKPDYFEWGFTNNNNVDMEGVEAEINYRLTTNFELSSAVSYIDQEQTTPLETGLYAKYAGHLSAVYRMNSASIALTHYANSTIVGESFGRTDLSLSGNFSVMNKNNIDWRIVTSYNHFDQISFLSDIGVEYLHSYDDRVSIYGSIGISF